MLKEQSSVIVPALCGIVHNRVTRRMNMLHFPRVRTYLAKNSFYYNGSVIFNRLNFQCFKILFTFTVTAYSPYFKINF